MGGEIFISMFSANANADAYYDVNGVSDLSGDCSELKLGFSASVRLLELGSGVFMRLQCFGW